MHLSSRGLPYSATFLQRAPKQANCTFGPPGTNPSTSTRMRIFSRCCCGLWSVCFLADGQTETGGDTHSRLAVLRAAELVNGLQMGGEAFWWPAVETWTTRRSFRGFQGGIQIHLAACASVRNGGPIVGTTFPAMLLGGQLYGPVRLGGTGRIEA